LNNWFSMKNSIILNYVLVFGPDHNTSQPPRSFFSTNSIKGKSSGQLAFCLVPKY